MNRSKLPPSQKNTYLVVGAFSLVGSILLIVSANLALNSYNLISQGIKAQGVITDVQVDTHLRKGKRTTNYRSTVEFSIEDGTKHTVIEKSEYVKGEPVEVLYLRGEPHSAKVNSFSSLWVGPVISGFFGLVLVLVMYYVFSWVNKRQKEIGRLLQTGKQVQAKIIAVNTIKNRTRRRSNRVTESYQYVVEYNDPFLGKPIRFTSDTFYKFPELDMIGKSLTVYYDQKNTEVSYVELPD